MRIVIPLFAALVFLAAMPCAAQDKATEDSRLAEQVESLKNRAKQLRSEFNFEEAEKVDAKIRELCLELDPRFVRGNELKERSVQARLKGRMEDAALYEREADRLFAEVKKEFSKPSGSDDPFAKKDPFAKEGSDEKRRLPEAKPSTEQLKMKEQQIAELTLRLKNVMEDLQTEQSRHAESQRELRTVLEAMEVRILEMQKVIEHQQERIHEQSELNSKLKQKLAEQKDKGKR